MQKRWFFRTDKTISPLLYSGVSASLERRGKKSRPLFGSHLRTETSNTDGIDDFRPSFPSLVAPGDREQPYDEPGRYRSIWLNAGVGAEVHFENDLFLECTLGIAPGYYEGAGESNNLYKNSDGYYRKKGKSDFVFVFAIVPLRLSYPL